MSINKHDMLYRSFDDSLSSEEKEMLETRLKESKSLREEKASIQSLRKSVSESTVDSFGPWFPEQVMARINALSSDSAEYAFFNSLTAFFRPLAIAAIVIIAALIPFNLDSNQQSTTSTLSETIISMEEEETLTYMEELL